MQFAMRVILLYLSVAFCDGSQNGIWPNLYEDLYKAYEDVIEPPLKYTGWSQEHNAPETSHYTDDQSEYEQNTPIIPVKNPETNPYNVMYRRRRNNKHTLVAGLDNLRPIDERSCLNDVLSTNSSFSSPVSCARTCYKGDRRICYYNFVVENYQVNGLACELCTPGATNAFCSSCQCVPADGVERSARTVNRQIPGPAIEVCEGDHVVIDVTNRMVGTDLTIHWHGLFQKEFQYYDGVPYITQCPITDGQTFRYQWGANNAGTHFWHAHSGLQKMDGVFGSIVVRQPPERDPHSHLYDYDLSTHVLIINDWMHNEALEYFPGRRFSRTGQLPDSILINGKGRYTYQNTGATTNTTLEVIDVEPGKRYRIRLINAFCTVCPGMLTIQDHNIKIIATDGVDTKPVAVDSVTSFAGERYDFVLHADKPVGSYWIQIRGMGECASRSVQQVAILRYKGVPSKPLSSSPSYSKGLPQGLVLNALNATCEIPLDDTICVSNLDSIGPTDKDILRLEPDLKFYLPINFHRYTLQEVFQPNQYNRFMVAAGRSSLNALIDGISFEFPHSPPLSQSMDVPDSQYCNRSTISEKCKDNNMCTCTHKLDIPLNAVVEILLVDELQATNLSHPFHMHGHAFYVMGTGRANVSSINWKIVQEMDIKNKVNRCFNKPVQKDTIAVPYNGYVVLRFIANNPGYWLFHCHFIYHQIVGMEMLLKVGDQKDIPPVPQHFPKCGDYTTPIGFNAFPPFTKGTRKPRRHP